MRLLLMLSLLRLVLISMIKKASELQIGDIIKDSSGIRVEVVSQLDATTDDLFYKKSTTWCGTLGVIQGTKQSFNYETGYDYEFEVED